MDKYQLWILNRVGKDYGHYDKISNYAFRKNKLWLEFGKYKKYDPWEVLENDPGYLIWAWKNVKNKLPTAFVDFIKDFSSDIKDLAEAQDDIF